MGLLIQFRGELNNIRRTKDKPKLGMASPQGDSANGSIYIYPREHLKQSYTKAYNMRFTQIGLEVFCKKIHYFIDINKSWWNKCHDLEY